MALVARGSLILTASAKCRTCHQRSSKLPDVARTAAALAKRAREAGLPESAQALEVAALAVKSYLDVGRERAGGAPTDRSSPEHNAQETKQV